LLLGVMEEDVLVDVFGKESEVFVVLFHEVLDGNLGAVLELGEEFLLQFRGERFGEGGVYRVQIEGQMDFFAVDDGDHFVNVIVESGELAEIVPDVFVGGVEDVRSVSVDHDAVNVAVVEAVAGDMVATVYNGDSGVRI